jgi:hypothetical protein
MYSRLDRRDQGNVKNDTSVGNGNREYGKKAQSYEI